MTTRRTLATIAAVLLILIVGVGVLYAVRSQTPARVLVPPSTPTATAVIATSTPVATAPAPSTSAPPAAGMITGRALYPAGFIPALTIYAISTTDRARSFFVQRPRFAEREGPEDRATFSITGVAPGTYWVVAWWDSDATPTTKPGLYSQFVVRCVQPSMAGVSPLPAECNNSRTAEHTLVPVTVRSGETVFRIDVGDWSYDQASYPPRPTPMGFLLPQGCRYVTAPVVTQPGPVTTWEFNCGVAPDLSAIERLSPAFAQQGWSVCRASSGGHGVWAKETTETFVNQSAAGNPTLSQVARSSQDCP